MRVKSGVAKVHLAASRGASCACKEEEDPLHGKHIECGRAVRIG